MKRVLLVCHANTCRSVMAHVLLERMLAERGVAGRVAVSAAGDGLHARDGMIPSLDARLALKEIGVHLAEDAMASTALRRHPEVLAEADLVITMTREQKGALASVGEADGRPVFTLRELAGEDGDIGDPVGQGDEVYRACRDEIARCLGLSLDRMLVRLIP
ncbi:MAG: low molecular weight protein arginine phosphatase [Candidatus Rokuibacteriota bacterium]